MTGQDDTSGSLRVLAIHLRRLGLRARLGAGQCPVLEVAPAGEPRAAASRLAYLVGLIRT